MPRCAPLLWVLAAMAPGAIAVTDPAPGSTAAPPAPAGLSPAGPPPAAPAVSHGCLPTGNGYLRARIRGALNLDINWRNADIECDGGLRPDGSALRMSFAGPPHGDGRRLRLVFGVRAVHEGRAGRALPTNLTVILEGEEQVFATRGDEHCTVDELRQERLGALGGPLRTWRVVARGFCTSPASALNSNARILVTRFDFAGHAVFEDAPAPSAPELTSPQARRGPG
ncbi:MAG: hypothetical protein E6K28_11340 [Gammaproteobacteria bacterium]|nr:MAG: hypothetical protein E6K28_11340 [Gammaproteobacteria bacterium]